MGKLLLFNVFYCCVDVHSFTLQIRNVLLRIICIIHLCDNDQRIFKSTHGSFFCLNNYKHTLSIITNLLLIYYSKSEFNHVVMTRTRKPAKKTSVVTEYRHGQLPVNTQLLLFFTHGLSPGFTKHGLSP